MVVHRIPVAPGQVVDPRRRPVVMAAAHQVMQPQCRHVAYRSFARAHHQVTTGSTTFGSGAKVWAAHSRASSRASARGSEANRPKEYQLAWSKVEPVQLRLLPMLAAPALPPS
jgi:hypothetical protein